MLNSTNRKFIGFFITLSKWQLKIQGKGYDNLDIIKKSSSSKEVRRRDPRSYDRW